MRMLNVFGPARVLVVLAVLGISSAAAGQSPTVAESPPGGNPTATATTAPPDELVAAVVNALSDCDGGSALKVDVSTLRE